MKLIFILMITLSSCSLMEFQERDVKTLLGTKKCKIGASFSYCIIKIGNYVFCTKEDRETVSIDCDVYKKAGRFATDKNPY